MQKMKDFGITSFGAYVPRLRIERATIAEAHKWMAPSLSGGAKGSRAFCGWDEDAITMAVEAARNCIMGFEKGAIKEVYLASTTLPYADLQNSAIMAGALGLASDLRCLDIAHSQRAGTSSLIQALKGGQNALVVASDRPLGKPASIQELSFGAGAAAFTVGNEGVIAKCLGTATITHNFVDHFRAAGARHDYFWEERWVRDEGYLRIVPEAVQLALLRCGLTIADITHFVMPSLQRGIAEATAKLVGFSGVPASGLENGCGYAGAAHSLLMLASVFEQAKPGERLLLVGFGQGADVIVLEITEALNGLPRRRGVRDEIADGLHTESYLRLLCFSDGVDLEWGMRAEKNVKTALTEQFRTADQTEGFIAGKCPRCGTVQFPQLAFCVNPSCMRAADQFEQVALVDEPCRLMTYTADWLSYHPSPPLYVGFVQFQNGARVPMEVVDVGPAGIEVGMPLKTVFRIKEHDKVRRYNRYFWKSTPSQA